MLVLVICCTNEISCAHRLQKIRGDIGWYYYLLITRAPSFLPVLLYWQVQVQSELTSGILCVHIRVSLYRTGDSPRNTGEAYNLSERAKELPEISIMGFIMGFIK